ncbi:uncharacterized protein LOC118278216 isoform X1 [Spodoptera frugiperda]|uniref:Uncharacterized protein LOC118278216 isoform X1 n=1 Tax=Spodoptera frugiperda TaxID=7108 RepID=A0A9R0DHS7_SPOFR|nr:uncharacterized protein LOC118278216 isoform X1 [Spodoptera frugiperda]XP_050556167.1 uncharacterized protein LOC118278216 isoform X1 [Spodoptera frugiperda]XP_050556168.1 uncharacterized protein LOC118278216 isoform X1 [Spodoptera frugiperda]
MNTFPIIFAFVFVVVSSKKSDDDDESESSSEEDYRPHYALYNCDKQKYCTKGGDKVCAIDYATNATVEFPDKCTFYGANCQGLGDYWIRKGFGDCRPTVNFTEIDEPPDLHAYATKSISLYYNRTFTKKPSAG